MIFSKRWFAYNKITVGDICGMWITASYVQKTKLD